jgi:hypothetical protein
LAKNRCSLLHGSAEEASNLPSWTQNSFTNNSAAGHKILSPITTSAWPALFITTNYNANFPMCICDDTLESYKSKAFFKINTDGSPYTLLKHAVTCITLALFHHQPKKKPPKF